MYFLIKNALNMLQIVQNLPLWPFVRLLRVKTGEIYPQSWEKLEIPQCINLTTANNFK